MRWGCCKLKCPSKVVSNFWGHIKTLAFATAPYIFFNISFPGACVGMEFILPYLYCIR